MVKKILLLIFCLIIVGLCLFCLHKGVSRQFTPAIVVGAITSIVAIAVTIADVYLDFILKSGDTNEK